MPQWIVPGWNPLGGRPPANDDEVFELLVAAVFQARFNPTIVASRWPALRAAFADFRLEIVARWADEEWEALLRVPGMIRNPKKIRATLRNARDLAALSQEHGGALAYLDSLGSGEALVEAIDGWAHYIGAPSIRWFVAQLDGRPPEGASPPP